MFFVLFLKTVIRSFPFFYEGIAQVAHQNEQMSKLLFFLAYHSFAHFFAKNERFALKTDEQIPNPDPDHLTQ